MIHPLPPIRSAALFALIGACAACAPSAEFPSLALRPAELNSSFEPPVRPPVIVANDPALLQRVASLEARARTGDQAFAGEAERAAGAVAAAGPAQGEAWVAAQVALSRLEASRAPTVSALADLDALRLERAAEPTSEGDFNRIVDAVAAAEAMARAQVARLEALQARLARR